jgi:serine/threonine protein kinase/tetratricopeptide (TPR) repeat protein
MSDHSGLRQEPIAAEGEEERTLAAPGRGRASHFAVSPSGRAAAAGGSGHAPPPKGAAEPHKRLPFLPAPGDTLLGFRLGQELGRGAFACVFLAEQHDLAGRPVVLKVSGTDGDEPQALAQLQHTNIVPIYSVHEDRDLGLRAVCMPYFGGASLSQVLHKLWAGKGRPTRGEQLVEALKAVAGPPWERSASDGRSSDAESTLLTILQGSDYVRAAAWVVARLAEGLHHAHQRGVLHRDVKSSNVLLGADGQPMLLDFNLAHQLHKDRATDEITVGGTIAYMAPEQLSALANDDAAAPVDQRSDLYSLGVVLHEMLTGTRPFDESGSYSPVMPQVMAMILERSRGVPSLRGKRPDVPWTLESIFRKCLAPNPEDRYQKADHLAEDLRRFLDDRPLKYAPEPSLGERVRKWVRRHPVVASSGSVAVAAALLLAGAGAGLVAVRQHLAQVREDLQIARAQDTRRAYEAGTVRALCLVNTTCDLDHGLLPGQSACEETLALYGVLDRDDWQGGPDWRRLAEEDRRRLGEDTRELLLLLAWSRVRLRPDDCAALEQAVALLDRAEAVEGLAPSRALGEDRSRYLRQLGREKEAAAAAAAARAIPPATARDHYLFATACARDGRYADAVRALDQALLLNPRHYWSVAQRGICRQELGQATLAVADFSTCVGLWPEFGWGYFNRGYALERSGHRDLAVTDYTAALERDADFVLAYLNRGLARLELKQHREALEDFDQAMRRGRDDAFLHAGRGAALEGLGRAEEADRAFAQALAGAGGLSQGAADRLYCAYAFAVAGRKLQDARASFDKVLEHAPSHPQALYGRAMLLVEAGQEAAAITCFDRALEAAPGFAEARRYRAILLARAGRSEQASQDVNACLTNDPEGGPTLYAAACVAARLAEKAAGAAADQLGGQALAFLERALSHGYGREKAATDPDLRPISGHPRFAQLLQSAGPAASQAELPH